MSKTNTKPTPKPSKKLSASKAALTVKVAGIVQKAIGEQIAKMTATSPKTSKKTAQKPAQTVKAPKASKSAPHPQLKTACLVDVVKGAKLSKKDSADLQAEWKDVDWTKWAKMLGATW